MIEPVADEASHLRALRRIEELWNAAPGSPEERELDALATLVDSYERKRFPILPPDPIAAIKARCEQLGWTRKDLEPILGSRARVSEILGGKRALTLPMIRKIHASMQIPAEILIAPPAPHRKGTKHAA
jgi:HTH-type transcriptional regulator / antitoxin HigA